MAEFSEVMTQFARLCDYYSQNGCHGCPVDEEGFNCACEKQGCSKSSAEELEAIIMSWAAEHPEPVYPTWSEWLVQMGVFPPMMSTNPIKAMDAISSGVCKPIPADIAQKLGIEPKEG